LGEHLEDGAAAGTAVGLVSLTQISDAAARIEGVAVRTPLIPVEHAAGRVWLKCESFQPTGAFKLRGAYNFIARLDPEERARGVITYSSGNHAQAVAYAAREFGVPATVVMPVDAPALKLEATRSFGADVELCGTLSTERGARAHELAAASGSPIVPPFDHPHIIAGQGTVGLELAEQMERQGVYPSASAEGGPRVLVPIGGGGLVSGVSAALGPLVGEARVWGVEPEGAASMKRSLEAGGLVTLESVETIADGLKPVTPGTLTYEHCLALVEGVLTVSDDEIRRAVRWCFARRLVVEPSGAAGIAALLAGRIPDGEGPIIIVISGGNIGWRRLQDLLLEDDELASAPEG
jgi:threonine dehydratase